MRSTLRLLVILFTLLGVAVGTTHAQNPYLEPWAGPRCRLNPYMGPAGVVVCDRDPLWKAWAQRYVIAEGGVGALDQELAWMVLLNLEDVPARVIVEYVIPGRPTTYFHRRTLTPRERVSIDLHSDPLFDARRGSLTFSAVTYFEGAGYAELVRRPLNDPFSKASTTTSVLVPSVGGSR
jgi:hypothetical protein